MSARGIGRRRRIRPPSLLLVVVVVGLSSAVVGALSLSPGGVGTRGLLAPQRHGLSLSLGAEAPRTPARKGRVGGRRPDGGGEGKKTPRRSEKWHALRRSGVRAKRRTKAPRWEREGDELYRRAAVSVDDDRKGREVGGDDDDDSEASVRAILCGAGAGAPVSSVPPTPAPTSDSPSQPRRSAKVRGDGPRSPAPRPGPGPGRVVGKRGKKSKINEPKRTAPPHTLWGTLPVGPVLRTFLLNSNLTEPTPIQISSFPVLSSGNNAVLASPTGSGKSLAYLLPLLASSKGRNVPCGIMIVTPTVELALQLRAVVDRLWPPKKGDECQSAMHVLGVSGGGDSEGEAEAEGKLLAKVGDAAVIGGTPRSLRRLMDEARDVLSSSGGDGCDDDLVTTAEAIRTNLRVVVLDEADRLLRTETAARERDEASDVKRRRGTRSPGNSGNDGRKPTQTQLLLSELPLQLRNVQLVCASATVGRTLRRQLMDMLDAPSVDKAATLVTAEGDARTSKGKDDEATARRRAGLVPDTLIHRYVIIPPSASESSSSDEEKDEGESSVRVSALRDVISVLPDDPPAPVLVFPGRIGVETVRRGLLADGTGKVEAGPVPLDVRTLADLRAEGGSGDGWDGRAPVYVVEDRFGRGLDVPDVRYVLLPGGPPSGPAGYAHLAGRTGRNGRTGTAVTFVRGTKEARRLASIADALGLSSLEELGGDGEGRNGGGSDGRRATQVEEEAGDAGEMEVSKTTDTARPRLRNPGDHPWGNLSEAALKRKTNAQLEEYLEGYGITVADPAGSKIRKADLVSAILCLDVDIAHPEG